MNELEIILYAAVAFGAVLAVVALKQKSLEGKITILGVAFIVECILMPYALYLRIPVFRGLLSGLFDFISTASPEVSGARMLTVFCLYLVPVAIMSVCMISSKEVAEYIMTLRGKITASKINENRKRLIEAPAG
ncbi:MAG: hypothetical protein KAQ87_01250 [Candidatus Pacebacteria bacterium]|nr:hypothetical protein [Candidatus Paceibacterota bacterium]